MRHLTMPRCIVSLTRSQRAPFARGLAFSARDNKNFPITPRWSQFFAINSDKSGILSQGCQCVGIYVYDGTVRSGSGQLILAETSSSFCLPPLVLLTLSSSVPVQFKASQQLGIRGVTSQCR